MNFTWEVAGRVDSFIITTLATASIFQLASLMGPDTREVSEWELMTFTLKALKEIAKIEEV
jgi:hypothetical protein